MDGPVRRTAPAPVPAPYTGRMGRVHQILRRAAAVLALMAMASCSAGQGNTGQGSAGQGNTAAGDPSRTPSAGAGPLTAELNQFRDNYSKQIIEIQLTNTTGSALTVFDAEVRSPLFESRIVWHRSDAGLELPPGQTKSLPAQLPAASCTTPPPSGQPADRQPAQQASAISVRVASADGTGSVVTAEAADPFGVLARNNAELCLARAAAGVAEFRLAPELEVAADARTAVLRLVITPRNRAGDVGGGGEATLTLDGIGGTTLLEEDPGAPWPSGLRVDAAGPELALPLGIRPARCDPHAVAEDKVGTLLPLRLTVAGREGVLKVGADAQLRGRIYDFVTRACGRQ